MAYLLLILLERARVQNIIYATESIFSYASENIAW